ncbi:MAG: ComEC family competence protein [Chitinophagaceae bacterium]|nr:ComEC family competence protein [Chitinophagaceae bacterium]
MQSYTAPIFKLIPSLRFLIALVIGILLQFHCKITLQWITYFFVGSLILSFFFRIFNAFIQFKFSWVKGILFNIVFVSLGALISWFKFIENRPYWIGNYFQENTPIIVTFQDNIVPRNKSYKAKVSVDAIKQNKYWKAVEGDMLLYFKKEAVPPDLHYGDQIIVTRNIREIINSGNPGGFNYAQFCAFQNISYQGFLNKEDYIKLPSTHRQWFNSWLLKCRTHFLGILKQNIKSKQEVGIAEALLIGYREELDRDMVKMYSNTGVVHIIAISGLHLGMIYALIVLLFKPLKKYKWSSVLKLITVVVVLWLFSFIAGLPASLLRSAIMFSVIAIGDVFGKRANIYNSLVVSALIILIINPFSLWDVGFQLSYTAVLSIVIFSPIIKRSFYFKNKLLTAFWNLNAITISAQLLTLPIVLYHFHQFPNLFLFTNLFAVPLSGFILYTEIILLLVSWQKELSTFLGNAIENLIKVLNDFVTHVNIIPFATWSFIQISILQTILLFIFFITLVYWIFLKQNKYLLYCLFFILLFIASRSIDFIDKYHQKKLIVYNVPNHKAIDVVEGRKYTYIGDDELIKDGFLRNFHVQPARIKHRIRTDSVLKNIIIRESSILSKHRKILLLDNSIICFPKQSNWDVVVISKNPKISIAKLYRNSKFTKVVFDGSNTLWKINQWKRECDSLHLQYHICSIQGAFEMNL